MLLLLTTACVPERVSWSPDGTRALLIGSDALHLCDPTGKLLGPTIPGEVTATWMPDSKHAIVLRQAELKTRQELAAAYPEEAAEIKDDTLDPAIERPLVQLYDLTGSDAKPGPIIAWLPKDGRNASHGMIRVSPTGQAVAISRISDSHTSDQSDILVFATDGSGLRMKIEAAFYPDWTHDGNHLVYIKPLNETTKDFGTLTRRKITDDKGQLIKKDLKPEELPAEETLTTLLYKNDLRVRTLNDGRILFTSIATRFPATDYELLNKSTPSLFSFNPGGGGDNATLSRVTPLKIKGEEDDAKDLELTGLFEVSPDGKRVSIVAEAGLIMVLDIATGTLQKIQPAPTVKMRNEKEILSLPSWRTADELTFIRPRSDSKGNEVIRHNLTSNQTIIISRDWPIAITDDWLDKKN